MNGHPLFYKLLEVMAKIHSDKNHDYASKADPFLNFRESEGFGIDAGKGVMVRMSDKWSRLKQLELKGEALVKDEALIDTLIDLANYSIIRAVIYLEKHPEALEPLLTKWKVEKGETCDS